MKDHLVGLGVIGWGVIAAAALVTTGATACSGSRIASDRPAVTTVVADGFVGPTQIANGPGATVLVAQLDGEEESGHGQVLSFDPTTKQRRVLLDGLDKPTGVAWTDGELWVMVRRGLLHATWVGGDATPAAPVTALAELPYNGRSEGTLTVLGDGTLLYETTGNLTAGGAAVPGSGMLWRYDPATGSSTPVASGTKNAYAHTMMADGRIATTEIGDNITDAPPEELNVFALGSSAVDLGWPNCRPTDVSGSCAQVVAPLATYPPSATPTGVAVIGGNAYVALFVTGAVVRTALDGSTTATALSGLQGPHTLLARADGTLWISEHLTGRILSWRPTG